MKLWFVIFGILASHLIEARPNSEEDDVATNNGDSVARKSDAIKSRVKRQAINEDLMDYFPMEDMDEMDGPDVNVDVNVNIKSGGVADVGINVNVESGGDDGGTHGGSNGDLQTSKPETAGGNRLYCSENCGKARVTHPRIVGGQDASVLEYPWQVILVMTSIDMPSIFLCGASIIKSQWILTASHCFVDPETSEIYRNITILASIADHNIEETTEAPSIQIELTETSIFVHPQYSHETMNNDIALVHLGRSLPFDSEIQPICMPKIDDYIPEMDVIVTGWGATSYFGDSSPTLQEVSLKLISEEDCQNLTQNAPIEFILSDNMICAIAPEKDSCTGDSGGPIITQGNDGRWVQLGIVSFGYKCAVPDVPGYYTKLVNYLEWITATTESDEC